MMAHGSYHHGRLIDWEVFYGDVQCGITTIYLTSGTDQQGAQVQ